MSLRKLNTSFRFENGKIDSLGAVIVRLTKRDGQISLDVDVVQLDVPPVLGLDELDREQRDPGNVKNIVDSLLYGRGMLISRHYGHIYITRYVYRVIFTRKKLYKMHRHFHHRASGKLLAIIKRSKIKHVNSNKKKMLDELFQLSSTCQTLSTKLRLFKLSMRNSKIFFNQAINL